MVIKPGIFKSEKWRLLKGSIEAAIIMSLLIRANNKTMIAYPSIKTLEKDAQACKRSILKAIKSLENKKCLIVGRSQTHYMKNGRNNIKKKNEYDLSQWRRFCALPKL